MKRFWTLMKKDWRVNRTAVIGLAIAMVLLYLIALIPYIQAKYDYKTYVSMNYDSEHHPHPQVVRQYEDHPFAEDAAGAALDGILSVILAAGVVGGSAFALERKDRSADFLAMLPVKRSEIILSKRIVALTILGTALAVEVVVVRLTVGSRLLDSMPEFPSAVCNFVASGLCLFGVAWVLSTFMSSTAIAASIAIVMVGTESAITGIIFRRLAPLEVTCALGMVGIALILAGSLYYTRRVAP